MFTAVITLEKRANHEAHTIASYIFALSMTIGEQLPMKSLAEQAFYERIIVIGPNKQCIELKD